MSATIAYPAIYSEYRVAEIYPGIVLVVLRAVRVTGLFVGCGRA